MTKEGYKGVSLKSEVADKFREAAEAEDMTLSSFLAKVLQSYSTGEKEVLQKGSIHSSMMLHNTITKAERYEKMIKKVEEMQEDIKAVREVLDELIR